MLPSLKFVPNVLLAVSASNFLLVVEATKSAPFDVLKTILPFFAKRSALETLIPLAIILISPAFILAFCAGVNTFALPSLKTITA